MTTEARTSSLHGAARHVDQLVEAVFDSVGTIRAETLRIAADAGARHEALGRNDLAALEPLLRETLATSHPRLAGTGLVLAVGALHDAPRQLEWWRRAANGSVSRLEPDLDPESVGFYDFTAAPWFRGPETNGARAVVGPYVDFSGTDEYVVTLTIPVRLHDRFLGVAGADLRLGDLAEAAMSSFLGLPGVACLVNEEGRVIVSTSPRWPVGSMLRDRARMDSHECRSAAWAVVGDGPA